MTEGRTLSAELRDAVREYATANEAWTAAVRDDGPNASAHRARQATTRWEESLARLRELATRITGDIEIDYAGVEATAFDETCREISATIAAPYKRPSVTLADVKTYVAANEAKIQKLEDEADEAADRVTEAEREVRALRETVARLEKAAGDW